MNVKAMKIRNIIIIVMIVFLLLSFDFTRNWKPLMPIFLHIKFFEKTSVQKNSY